MATNNTLPATAHGIDLGEVLYIHTTPYNADSWSVALTLCNLTSDFPNLVHDIKSGSPIGNPPPLSTTFLPRNLPSTDLFPTIIDHELLEETAANRMSGPFTEDEARYIFKGHFRTSPVSLVEKYPGDGKWRMIRHLSKTDGDGFSMNQWLDSTDFPTVFYSVATVASYVSLLLIAHLTNASSLLFPSCVTFRLMVVCSSVQRLSACSFDGCSRSFDGCACLFDGCSHSFDSCSRSFDDFFLFV